jgi:ribosome-binding ATPase
VRCFDDPNVIHVAGKVDPLSDIAVIDTELALADMGTGEKALHRFNKVARAGDKEAIKMVAILEPIMKHLDQGNPVRSMGLDADQMALIKPLCFITAKPVLYVANVIEGGFENNPLLDLVKAHAAKEGAPVTAICAKIEAEIADLEDEDKEVFLADIGMTEPGLNRLIRSAYTLLGLETYFTAGVKEVRAWTVHKGSTAPQAAGVIHTDFERGFIRAEVIAFNDYVTLGGEAKSKEAGKMRLEGKEYIVKDGDVMHFRFNV